MSNKQSFLSLIHVNMAYLTTPYCRDAREGGGVGGQPPLLPFDRRGKRGQIALYINVPLKLVNCDNQIDSYEI